MNINLHHIELFYYVARHGGLSEAARKMPYRLDPSTISRQLCEFEEEIKFCLYERRPFKLTSAGQELFESIRPMFEQVPGVIQRLQVGVPQQVRLGASPVVLRDYLPAILSSVQQGFPQLRLTINEGLQWQIDEWLREKIIDLAVTVLDGDLPSDYQCEPLLRLPLILLVPQQAKLRSASELLGRKRIEEKLISPPPDDALSRYFRQGLQRYGSEWPIGMQASSIGLVETYVEKGFGYGVALALPGREPRPALRALPLPDFPRVPVGMIWRRNPGTVTQALMTAFRQEAAQWVKSHRGTAVTT